MYFKKLNQDLTSPYQGYQWELGKQIKINNFDTSNLCCSTRLYYLKLDQLLFCPAKPIFEVEIGGQIKEFEDKNGCSEMTVLREVPKEEILELIREANLDEKLGYKYGEAIYPVNPFKQIRPPMITEDIITKLKRWTLVHDTIEHWVHKEYSVVDNSVQASIEQPILNLILDSLSNAGINIDLCATEIDNSVIDAIEAYIITGLLLNKYQSAKDCGTQLWYQGLIPSYDGTEWRLHGGPKAKILYEMAD